MTHDQDILDGVSRGVWADLWANEQEEKGVSFSGMDVCDCAPKTPRWAQRWARKVANAIVEANGKSLEDLYQLVRTHGYPYDRAQFGLHLGMQTAGHGMSWSDDTRMSHDMIKVPYREFYR